MVSTTRTPVPSETTWRTPWIVTHWTAAAYVCIGFALLAVLVMVCWGAYHDLELVRSTMTQSEMNRLRTHAVRTVGLIQDQLRHSMLGKDLSVLRREEFSAALRAHWSRSVLSDESRRYAAIVDSTGEVILHSHVQFEGRKLAAAWYDRTVDIAGDDVVETTSTALSSGHRCFDVRVPIFHDQTEIGAYHSGLDVDWLEQELAGKQKTTWERWGVLLSVMFAVVLVAGIALFYITRRLTVLGEAVKLAHIHRFAELGQLMAGIVHEIRNPLNAMRLNLHVLDHYQKQNPFTAEDDADQNSRQIIQETNREIERVEELMRILLGYARPDKSHEEELDLRIEVESTLTLLKPTLEKAEVIALVQLPDVPVIVRIDRDRFRQILINLIANAKDATGTGGTIRIQIQQNGDLAELVVADDGPGVPPTDRERIFEPFFTTKEMGTGLGLSLVKRFVEEARGKIDCEKNEPHGARLILRFPVSTHSREVSSSSV